jgi:hypothetical protein
MADLPIKPILKRLVPAVSAAEAGVAAYNALQDSISFDPRPYREVYDDEKGEWVRKLLPQKPPKKQIDFPSRQKEIDAENWREAKARKQLEEEMDYGPGTGSQWPRWHHKHPDNKE